MLSLNTAVLNPHCMYYHRLFKCMGFILTSNSYARQCELYMPQLEYVFSNFAAAPVLPFDNASLMQLVKVGLSASNFRNHTWKLRTITVANDAANALQVRLPARVFYLALISVKKGFIAHLYQSQSE